MKLQTYGKSRIHRAHRADYARTTKSWDAGARAHQDAIFARSLRSAPEAGRRAALQMWWRSSACRNTRRHCR